MLCCADQGATADLLPGRSMAFVDILEDFNDDETNDFVLFSIELNEPVRRCCNDRTSGTTDEKSGN